MRIHQSMAVLALSTSVIGACARTTTVASGGDVSNDVIPSTARALPVGAMFDVRLDQTISASRNRVGDSFTAHVTDAITAQNGAIVVPAGAMVQGTITGIEPSGGATHPGLIKLDFSTLTVDNRSYPLNATVERTSAAGQSNDELLKKAGVGAAVGGILGAVIGRDVKDILIGGAIGAAAGSLISLGTDNTNAALPEGTRLTLRNDHRIALRY